MVTGIFQFPPHKITVSEIDLLRLCVDMVLSNRLLILSGFISTLRPTIMGKYFFWLSELNSGPIIPVLLGWTVENTDTLFKIHHVVFRGLSGAVLCFSRVSF